MRAIVLLSVFVFAVMAQNSNLIQNLPGLTFTPKFRMYSGYISVSSSKQLFYWFVESANAPSTDPLILWLNGGPGCSSLGGLLSENGPFSPDNNGTLIPNPYSWNTVANVLYLESPAGVGFSIFNPNGVSGDNSTADDAFTFLQKWFAACPKYQNNDFYIAGESYGGHYIPTLAYRIAMAAQNKPGNYPQKNFRGFLVGNPLVNVRNDTTIVNLKTNEFLVSTGTALTELALKHNYNVVAAVRRPDAVKAKHERLHVVKTDLADEVSIQNSVKGADLVISCIGGSDLKPNSICTDSTVAIFNGMKKVGVKRLIVISSCGLYDSPDYPIFYEYFMRRYLLKNVYIDLDNMELKIKDESDWLDWTIIRPGGFFDGPITGRYRYRIETLLPQGMCQSIADVAHSCLAFSTDKYIRKTVAISY